MTVVSAGRTWLARTAVGALCTVVSLSAWARISESPQHFAFEVKFGPYSPDIDSEFGGGAKPFELTFGGGTALLSRIEFDVQLLRLFGSLGAGLSVGYYNASGQPCAAPSDENSTSTSNCDQKTSGDKTKLTLVPIAALAVYRLDVLAERFAIPLVPYVKFGLNYTLWWMRRGDGSVSQSPVGKGRGGNLGWQLNAGLALRLDPFNPGAARSLDAEVGVNHTYLFGELLHVETGGEPRLGDTTFMGGLVMEF